MITKVKTKTYEEWKALRKKYIGGSDASAVIGLNPYKSAYALWAEKTGKIPEFEGNLATEVGTYLEDFVAKKFEEETGLKVRRDTASIFNSKYPWAIANVDRMIVGEDAILECKTTSELNLKKFKNGEYPPTYYCQVMHYLAVTGKKKAYIAVLIGNRDFKVFEVERDEDEINALMEAESKLYELIQKGIAPEPDGLKSTSTTLTTLYPESNDQKVNLQNYAGEIALYISLGEQIKQMEESKEKVANRIKAYMQDNGRGETDRYNVTWTSAERKSLDTKRLKKERPDLDLSGYYNTSNYRTFKVTEKGE